MKKITKLLLPTFFMLAIILTNDLVYADDYKYTLPVTYIGNDSRGAAYTYSNTFKGNQPLFLVCAPNYIGRPYDFHVYSKDIFTNYSTWDGYTGCYAWNCPQPLSALTSVSCKYYYFNKPNNTQEYYDAVKKLLNGDSSDFEVVSSEKYDAGIGAIKNVKRNILYDRSSDELKAYYRFSFDSKTTLGYNLKTPGTKIRVYETQTYYKRKTNDVVYEGNKVLIGDFDATKLYFDFDATSTYSKVAAETTVENVPSSLDVVFKQLVRDDNLYLQVITPDSKLGYILRISGSSDAERFEASPQDVLDESGNVVSDDNGGYHKDDTLGGSGETYDGDLDTANDNANKNAEEQQKYQNGSMDVESAKGTLKDMLDMVNYIPFMIAKLFSYLPSWCLNMLALFFTASVVLAVYKLFRG